DWDATTVVFGVYAVASTDGTDGARVNLTDSERLAYATCGGSMCGRPRRALTRLAGRPIQMLPLPLSRPRPSRPRRRPQAPG
ncbi:hypothetical protein ABK046_50540, partial [Streptomyces caeruleatus]